jgi:hypothetical protein
VDDVDVTVAASPAIVTVVIDVKPVPVIVAAEASVSVAGVMDVIERLAAAVTVTLAIPDLSSLVAVIVAVPAATPVTTPVAETVATPVLDELHVVVLPVRVPPTASLRVAVSVWVAPTPTLAADGATVTLATGTIVTVIVALPDLPSLVAVAVAVPAAIPVTTPTLDTLATLAFDEVHVTVRPISAFPPASLGVAVSACVAPTLTFATDGATVTVATGGGVTVMADAPDLASLVAVIVALPAATAVTRPPVLTRALVESDVVHATTRPVSGIPPPSSVAAVSCCVAPTARVTVAGVTDTVATGTGMTVNDAWPVRPLTVAVMDT